ncbi:hypothetical protein BS47DRAFT_1390234 [Hydnum rufescens UP504]|uniref:Uncharacterized protein n=1 Tax=Hydnum rufescens UP504 TaxID=1448309 RepID=A0A9P6B3B5_9AGAM|nr:hypothetical protein BS47DRAFT_1390234 [Hydnum rufescens UP504]
MGSAAPPLAVAASTTNSAPTSQASQEVDVALLFDATPPPPQWSNHINAYLSRLVSHIHTLHTQTPRIRLAVITYSRAGSAATVPEVIMNELKDHGIELGLGRGTTAGGSAILEAIMFDNILSVRPTAKKLSSRRTNISPADLAVMSGPRPSFHIILFSHSQPNINARAEWNQSDKLDNTTWERLPDELRKRDAHLNMVLMMPSPALAQLHARTVDRPEKSWFPIPPQHSLLLSGFMVIPSTSNSPTTTKRPHSAINESNSNGAISTATNAGSPETLTSNKRVKHEPRDVAPPPLALDSKQAQPSSKPPTAPPQQPQPPARTQEDHTRSPTPPTT